MLQGPSHATGSPHPLHCRGFLAKDPREWVASLDSKGLLCERVLFEDPWVGLVGPQQLGRYMRQVHTGLGGPLVWVWVW